MFSDFSFIDVNFKVDIADGSNKKEVVWFTIPIACYLSYLEDGTKDKPTFEYVSFPSTAVTSSSVCFFETDSIYNYKTSYAQLSDSHKNEGHSK